MSTLNKRKRKIQAQRLVYTNNNHDHDHETLTTATATSSSSSSYTCDMENINKGAQREQRLSSLPEREFPKSSKIVVMDRKRRSIGRMCGINFKPNLLALGGVKLFILVSILANLYNHLYYDQSPSLLLQAEAGSKSSKSSSKTTVIAIDGGGGGGNAKPMPVPWPIVHCHHHHHHLKYVPKPILVHHWVKKQKLHGYEIAASDKQPLELVPEKQTIEHQSHDSHESESVDPKAILKSLDTSSVIKDENSLPYELAESNKLVSRLTSVFEDHQPQQFPPSTAASSNQVNLAYSNADLLQSHRLPVKPGELITTSSRIADLEKELKRLESGKKLLKNTYNSNNNHHNNVTNKNHKNLDKFTQSLLSNSLNMKKHFSNNNEADSDDGPSGMNANSSGNHTRKLDSMIPPPVGGSVWSTDSNSNDKMLADGSRSQYPHTMASKIEPRQGRFTRSDFLANLEMANRMEQSQSERLFRKMTSEQEGRMQALDVVNQLLQAPGLHLRQQQQQQQQTQPTHHHLHHLHPQTLAPTLYGPMGPQISKPPQGPASLNSNVAISARVASVLSESRAIEAMMKLAEQMARREAKRLIGEQQRKLLAGKSVARNSVGATPAAPRGLLRNLNLFSMFHQPTLKYHRNRRRRDSPFPLLYDSVLQGKQIKVGPVYEKLTKQMEAIKSFNMNRPWQNNNNHHQFGSRTLSRGPSSGLMIKNYRDLEQISGQESGSINKIVDPPIQGATAENSSLDTAGGSKKLPEQAAKDQPPPKAEAEPISATTEESQTPPKQDEFSLMTAMSPDQEDQFYDGQRNHLMKQRRQVEGETQSPLLIGTNQTRIYNSSPSSMHTFVVEAPAASQPDTSSPLGNKQIDSSSSSSPQAQSNQQPAGTSFVFFESTANGPSAGAAQIQQVVTNPTFPMDFPWEQPRHLRSVMDPQAPQAAQSLVSPIKSPNSSDGGGEGGGEAGGVELPVTATSEGGRLYQNFAENLVPMPTYLEFPMSPQFWSAEAMKSMNKPSQTTIGSSMMTSNSSVEGQEDRDNATGDKATDLSSQSDSSDATSNEEALYDLSNGQSFPMFMGGGHKQVAFEHQFAPSAQSQLQQQFQLPQGPFQAPMLAHNEDPEAQHSQLYQAMHQGQPDIQQQQALFNYNPSPGLLFASDPTNHKAPFSSANHGDLSYLYGPPMGAASHYTSTSIYGPTGGGGGGGRHRTMASKKSKKKANDGDHLMQASLISPSAQTRLVNSAQQQQQYNPMEVATNDMRQLGQFQNVLSQASGQANNLTSMTRFSRQIRDQSGRLPQMPQIPNIPQPPQIPNLPMPPPGMMMQMAGLALPFAWARATREANRVRDQRVNAAAQGGGSTAPKRGQGIFNRALTLTNRLSRPRPRPSSSPLTSQAISSSPTIRNRNRFMGFVQTVVDMSRRPAGATIPSVSSLTKSTPKLKPKVDNSVSKGSRAKRLGRAAGLASKRQTASESAGGPKEGQSGPGKLPLSTVIMPSSVLATATDGNINGFASMTSPMDMLAEQLASGGSSSSRGRVQKQRRQVPEHPHHPHHHLSSFSSSSHDEPTGTYEIIDERAQNNALASGHGPALVNGLLPVPMVANHINLLLFTAQNVTGQLMRLPSDDAAKVSQNEQQQQQQQQQQQEQQQKEQQQEEKQPETSQDDGASKASGAETAETKPSSTHQQQQQQEPERESATTESLLQAHALKLASNMESFGGRTSRPDGDQQAAGSQSNERPALVSEQGVKIPFTGQFKSQPIALDRKELPLEMATEIHSSTKEADQHDKHLAGASVVAPVVHEPRDPFQWSVAGSSSSSSPPATKLQSAAGPFMPLIALTQFEPITRPTHVPDRWDTKGSLANNDSSRFTARNKSKRSTTRPLELKQQQQDQRQKQEQQKLEGRSDMRSKSNATTLDSSTPVASTPISSPIAEPHTQATAIVPEATTTDHPIFGSSSPMPHPDDYVRAIKLVRGVAYPWAPPTKSSKSAGLLEA